MSQQGENQVTEGTQLAGNVSFSEPGSRQNPRQGGDSPLVKKVRDSTDTPLCNSEDVQYCSSNITVLSVVLGLCVEHVGDRATRDFVGIRKTLRGCCTAIVPQSEDLGAWLGELLHVTRTNRESRVGVLSDIVRWFGFANRLANRRSVEHLGLKTVQLSPLCHLSAVRLRPSGLRDDQPRRHVGTPRIFVCGGAETLGFLQGGGVRH